MNRILTYPEDNKLLRRKAKRVTNPQSTEAVIAVQTMVALAEQWERDNPGQKAEGLAATQIGVPLRIILMRNATDDPSPEHKWMVMYNPVYVKSEGMQDSEEACLSVPGVSGLTLRPEKSEFHFYDHNLRRHPEVGEYVATGFTSAALCHELDHLNGVLFIDSAVKLWRTGSKPSEIGTARASILLPGDPEFEAALA